MTALATRATELLRMHDDLVVLPTVWDPWSARAVVAAGFRALSVGSHPLATARGEEDGERMRLEDVLAEIARITAAVDVPVSADLESGYDTPAAELIERLLAAGAVGLNIEDTVHSEQRMREPQEHADYIAGLREAADAAGVDVVINARTDAFLSPRLHDAERLEQAILRMELAERAGARSLYPVRPPSAEALGAILERVTLPVNVTAHPVQGSVVGDLAAIRASGARRVTFGPRLQQALTDTVGDLVRPWR
ncbi:isocitrate lyase/phosphoenolpyruvate mutase family protein [Agrococcus sp. ProA11]|uniref:isocitrate lyase/PEP mutase family protein n=1 Tax=Agrococcus chionoecetis TaxID=3153752 RepID=UPI0032606C85